MASSENRGTGQNESGFIATDANIYESVYSYVLQWNPNNLPPIGEWNTSQVTNMSGLFNLQTEFDEDISNWDVSNVTDMGGMFNECSEFNQPLNSWNVSNVRTMVGMFGNCERYNQPLNNWNVSNVLNFRNMFKGASSFNKDLSTWNISPYANVTDMFLDATSMSDEFKPQIQREPQRPTQIIPQPIIDDEPTETAAAIAERNIQTQTRENLNTGIAYHVHNRFNEIDMNKLIELINNGKITTYPENFIAFIKNELQTMIDNYDESDKPQLQTMFNGLQNKIRDMTFNKEDMNLYYTIINFVKRQDKKYQDNYIKVFLNECSNAYEGSGDNTSCVRGIKERIVFALGQAGFDIDNPLYANISELLFPLSNAQIYTFLNNCIKENQSRLEEMGKSINEKKALIKQCMIEKLRASSPNINVSALETKLNKALNEAQDMLGGKRKTRRTKRIYRKNGRRHSKRTIKKYSKRTSKSYFRKTG